MMKKVMIDPGHAPGNANKGPTGYYEYAGMWEVSGYLKEALTRCGVEASLTREEHENPTLRERGRCATGCDLFVSEHSNASDGTTRGTVVFFSTRRPNDQAHAAALSSAISTLMQNPDFGARTRIGSDGLSDYYTVIYTAQAVGCPHIFLVESGFHDHPEDEAFLKSSDHLRALAETQAEAMCKILSVPYVAPASPATPTSPVSPATHWALPHWEALRQNGIELHEQRFDDPISRGELFAVLAQLPQVFGVEGSR